MKRITLAALVALAFTSPALADQTRIEFSAGNCHYGRAPDGAWWKEHYYSDFSFDVPCGAVAISKTPWRLFGAPLGWRIAWADLGRPRARTHVPAMDDEANSFPGGDGCDPTKSWRGCVGHWEQKGGAYGLSLGAIIEKRHRKTTLGLDAGLFHYKSWWYVFGTLPAPGTCSSCIGAYGHDWNMAEGRHTTTYIGFTAEYDGWFAQVRRYTAIYASRTDIDRLAFGAIAGPLVQVTAGYRWKF